MLILGINGINLHVVNACLIKLDQLKVLITVKPCQLFLVSAMHVIYRCFIYDVDDGYFICLFMG